MAGTAQQKPLRRGATARLSSSRTGKGDLVAEVLEKEMASSMPVDAANRFSGRRPSRLPALEGSVPGRSDPTNSTSMASKRPSSSQGVASATCAVAPQTPSSRRCPVRRRASTTAVGEVHGLNTQQLGAVLRRRGTECLDSPITDDKDDCDNGAEAEKVVRSQTAIIGTETGHSEDASDQVVAPKLADLNLLMSDELHNFDYQRAAQPSTSVEGLTFQQRKRLEGRRRSLELQALLCDEEGTEGEPKEREQAAVADVILPISKEEQYWQEVWQIAKIARNDAEANDARVDKDLSGGPSPFDVSERMTTQAFELVSFDCVP